MAEHCMNCNHNVAYRTDGCEHCNQGWLGDMRIAVHATKRVTDDIPTEYGVRSNTQDVPDEYTEWHPPCPDARLPSEELAAEKRRYVLHCRRVSSELAF